MPRRMSTESPRADSQSQGSIFSSCFRKPLQVKHLAPSASQICDVPDRVLPPARVELGPSRLAFNTMKSKLLLFAVLALGCSAQVLPTAVRDEPSRIVQSGAGGLATHAFEPRVVTLPIKMSDVTGLSAALSQINTSLASLTTTVGNLNATLTRLSATVDTLSGTVSSLVPVPTFVDFETPVGLINGSNAVFLLNAAPSPASSLVLIRNGLQLSSGGDYSLSGSTVQFSVGAIPQSGDLLIARYRH